MAHPFTKLFTKSLKKSVPESNLVYETAKQIVERGYSHAEVDTVLEDLARGLLDDVAREIIAEARNKLVDDIADPSD